MINDSGCTLHILANLSTRFSHKKCVPLYLGEQKRHIITGPYCKCSDLISGGVSRAHNQTTNFSRREEFNTACHKLHLIRSLTKKALKSGIHFGGFDMTINVFK